MCSSAREVIYLSEKFWATSLFLTRVNILESHVHTCRNISRRRKKHFFLRSVNPCRISHKCNTFYVCSLGWMSDIPSGLKFLAVRKKYLQVSIGQKGTSTKFQKNTTPSTAIFRPKNCSSDSTVLLIAVCHLCFENKEESKVFLCYLHLFYDSVKNSTRNSKSFIFS